MSTAADVEGPFGPRHGGDWGSGRCSGTSADGRRCGRGGGAAGAGAGGWSRDPAAPAARALEARGVELVEADLEESRGLIGTMKDVCAVYSVQAAPARDRGSERRQAANLIGAARNAGVSQFVQSSVSGSAWISDFPDIAPGVLANYWQSKQDVESAVRAAGFPTWTILRPAFLMDNFVAPKVRAMFPHLSRGELAIACDADTRLPLVAADDVAKAVVAVLGDPSRFHGAELDLCSQILTFRQIAATLARATGGECRVRCLPAAEIDAVLGPRSWSAMQVWFEQVGYPATPEGTAAAGVDLDVSLEEFMAQRV